MMNNVAEAPRPNPDGEKVAEVKWNEGTTPHEGVDKPNGTETSELSPTDAEKLANNATERISKEDLQKLSVIMHDYDKLSPSEQKAFEETLAGIQKDVGYVFTNFLRNKNSSPESSKWEKVEPIDENVSSPHTETINISKRDAMYSANLALDSIKQSPQVLTQLSMLVKNEATLSPDQYKVLRNAIGEIQTDINKTYTLIQQKRFQMPESLRGGRRENPERNMSV